MTDKLPPQLLALFAARPPLRWLEAPDYAPEKRTTAKVEGIAAYLPQYKQALATDDGYVATESWLDKRDRKKREKKEAVERLAKEGPATFKPNEDPNVRGDAYKTMIVARLSYEADERDLEREFSRFGPIERIRIVKENPTFAKPNKKSKPHRGYAFVVFERERDMRAALDKCDGMRIKDRQIKLDVERARTMKNWLPRRLGGGLGGRGYTKTASRPAGPGSFGGGFRGGHRGFDGGRGRGGFRGGRGGFRGSDRNGFGAPNGAPSGPGGFDRRNGDRGFSNGGGRSHDDRSGGFRENRFGGDRDNNRRTGSNMEPIGRREGGGYRDRDRDADRPRDDDNRKRGYEGGYDDSRKQRRY